MSLTLRRGERLEQDVPRPASEFRQICRPGGFSSAPTLTYQKPPPLPRTRHFPLLLLTLLSPADNVLQKWCVATSTQSCVGPALKWNTGATGFLTDSNADGYRTVVTTDLNTVLDIWLPIVLGCLILSSASPSMRSSNLFTATIAYSWPKMATCLFLTGLFGAFGYNGNFGILTGLLCSFSAIWCGLVHVLALHDGKFPCANQVRQGVAWEKRRAVDANVRRERQTAFRCCPSFPF